MVKSTRSRKWPKTQFSNGKGILLLINGYMGLCFIEQENSLKPTLAVLQEYKYKSNSASLAIIAFSELSSPLCQILYKTFFFLYTETGFSLLFSSEATLLFQLSVRVKHYFLCFYVRQMYQI